MQTRFICRLTKYGIDIRGMITSVETKGRFRCVDNSKLYKFKSVDEIFHQGETLGGMLLSPEVTSARNIL